MAGLVLFGLPVSRTDGTMMAMMQAMMMTMTATMTGQPVTIPAPPVIIIQPSVTPAPVAPTPG